MSINKKTQITKLIFLLMLPLSLSTYANQITSDFSQDFTTCFKPANLNGENLNWGEVENINSLINCNDSAMGDGAIDQNITSYTNLNINSDICEGGLFYSRFSNNNLSRLSPNQAGQVNFNENCLFLLPNGNDGQTLSAYNINDNVRCTANFSCGGSGWSMSNNQGDKNTQYCESRNFNIRNPIYSNEKLTNYYINSLYNFNNSGIKTVRIPKISTGNTYEHSYSYGGFNITHTFACNENTLNTSEQGSPTITRISECANIPEDINFKITGVSEHPSNSNYRAISCSLNANSNSSGITGQNILRSQIVSKLNEGNTPLILETETSGLNLNNSYGFFKDTNMAVFKNNLNSAKAVLGCIDNSGWQVLSGTCSNIRNRECFEIYSELHREDTINIKQSPITTIDGTLDYNPKKRRVANGDFVEDYLIFKFIGQTGNSSFCFNYGNLEHEL